MGNLLLLAEVASKVPKAEVAAKNTDEFDGQNLTVKMNLTVKEESVKQKSTERLAGKKSKKKKLQCGVCGQIMTNMKRHMMTHTDEKPHSCPICKKNFPRSDKMKEHMRTHTGVKPYVCPVCRKSFSQLHHRKYHIERTHAGVKPYSLFDVQ
ncbi:zinc finger protein [Loa loa]|uniref:Zinc finger protein n=1 Tax=Loa loa TaxID=7209 RepID=A0A1I7V7L8_LOALO|nr:zinc finger protein [Loa loa]EFO17022.2 zinc finger protein [Loa loa]